MNIKKKHMAIISALAMIIGWPMWYNLIADCYKALGVSAELAGIAASFVVMMSVLFSIVASVIFHIEGE